MAKKVDKNKKNKSKVKSATNKKVVVKATPAKKSKGTASMVKAKKIKKVPVPPKASKSKVKITAKGKVNLREKDVKKVQKKGMVKVPKSSSVLMKDKKKVVAKGKLSVEKTKKTKIKAVEPQVKVKLSKKELKGIDKKNSAKVSLKNGDKEKAKAKDKDKDKKRGKVKEQPVKEEIVVRKRGRPAKEKTAEQMANGKSATGKDKKIKASERFRDDSAVALETATKVDIEKEIKESLVEEIFALSENFSIREIFDSLKVADYFQSDSDECLEKDCDNPDTTLGYCRYHYIKNWADIKKKQNILLEGKLQKFVMDLMEKYPIKYLEAVLADLADEKAFYNSLKELDIESAAEVFDDVDNDLVEDEQDIAFETKGLTSKDFEEI